MLLRGSVLLRGEEEGGVKSAKFGENEESTGDCVPMDGPCSCSELYKPWP